MEEVKVTRDGAILTAEFFKNSGADFLGYGMGLGPKNGIYGSLIAKDLLMQKERVDNGERFIGEIQHIFIDKRLNPYLAYNHITWFKGNKQYGLENKVQLTPSCDQTWFEFIIDPEFRNRYSGLRLHLPKRYFLDKQSP